MTAAGDGVQPSPVTRQAQKRIRQRRDEMSQSAKPQRRYSVRIPVSVDVALYDRAAQPVGAQPLRMKSRDISVGGMFIETMLRLAPDIDVVLAFGLRHRDERPYYRLPATVVRVAPDGVGVMFNRLNREVIDSLRRVLHHQQLQCVVNYAVYGSRDDQEAVDSIRL